MQLILTATALMVLCSQVCSQERQLAAEGRGLLPVPIVTPTPPSLRQRSISQTQSPAITLPGTGPHPFEPDPSGGYSRTIFETDEDPNFKIIIRDFSVPPDQQAHAIILPAAAVLHFVGEPGEVSVANRRLALTPHDRTMVSANSPVEVVNRSDRQVVTRAFIVEAK
jgi:hypothetical protein